MILMNKIDAVTDCSIAPHLTFSVWLPASICMWWVQQSAIHYQRGIFMIIFFLSFIFKHLLLSHIAEDVSLSFVNLYCCQRMVYTAFIMYSHCTQHLIFCKSGSDGKHHGSLKQYLRHLGSDLIKCMMMKCSECQYLHVLCLLKFPINHRLHNLAV